MVVVVAVALASALSYAVATVLQQHSARQVDERESLRPGLLVQLAFRPWWIAGIAANLVGYGLRFFALRHGSMVLVQPLLVSGLLFAVVIGSVTTGRALHPFEWAGIAAISVGLGVFLVAANPATGRHDAPATAWLAWAVATVVPAAALVALGRRYATWRPQLLAGAGGLLLALAAAFTKAVANTVDLAALSSWKPWALVAVALAGTLVVQSAFQAGPLPASLSVLSVVEPVASILFGEGLFHENINRAGVAPGLEVMGLALLVTGIVAVTRSPVVATV